MRIVIVMLAIVFPAGPAYAWDDEMLWNNPSTGGNGQPGAVGALMPGGGGIYGTGGPRDYNITCASCHLNDKQQQGKIDGSFTFNPVLGAGSSYKPGQLYTVTVKLLNEQLGKAGCDQYVTGNINNFGASFEDASGKTAGLLSSDSGQSAASCPSAMPEGLTSGTTMLYGDCHAITGFGAPKRMVNITTWTFSWQAPAAGAGPITLYWGVVDGDCVMDSFGDDVKTGTLKLTEGMAQLERRSPPYALALILVPIVLAVSRGRRRS